MRNYNDAIKLSDNIVLMYQIILQAYHVWWTIHFNILVQTVGYIVKNLDITHDSASGVKTKEAKRSYKKTKRVGTESALRE